MKKIGFILPLLVICIWGLIACSKQINQPTDTTADSAPCQHNFEGWSTVLKPTCSTSGQEERVCTACQYKEQRTLSAEGEHIYVDPGKCKICSAVMSKDFIFILNSDGLSYSFRYNGNVAAVIVPESYNELPVTQLSDGAFEWCTELLRVQLPNSIVRIGNTAFKSCPKLTDINTPENLTTIGEEAFAGCRSLTSFYIPDAVTRIEYYTFSNSGLKSIVFPNTLTYIGESAFTGCRDLATLKIPASVTEMGEYAFSGCSGLREIKIENNTKLTTIPTGAFSAGNLLKELIVPEGIVSIESKGFNGHSFLQTVILPSTLKKIGEEAFYNPKLTANIYYNGTSEAWAEVELGNCWIRDIADVQIRFLK